MNATLTYSEIVTQYQNKYKSEGYPFDHDKYPDPNFNKYEWVKIPVKLESREKSLFPFVIAISEIIRFEVNTNQPEYRLSETHILSKKIPQGDDVGQFDIRTLYYHFKKSDTPPFWEGMGRVVLIKYIFQDNDFNFYNALIDKNDYFIAIDSDKTFWSVVEKYHLFRDIKVQRYNNTPFPASPFVSVIGQKAYLIQGKKRSFVGDMHAEDYQNLPLLKHYYPTDWFFLSTELSDYSKKLTTDQRFLNEKYFATFKTLITSEIKHLLIDLHLIEEADNKQAHQFVDTQLEKLNDICKNTDDFKNYIDQNAGSALLAIIYELKLFFKHSKNYQLADKKLQLEIEATLINNIITQAKNLLQKLPARKIEDNQLQKIAQTIFEDPEQVRTVKDFYNQQLMNFHASQIEEAFNNTGDKCINL